ncbi:MAG: DUF3078 domain-containing protein [Muribaculaceae bacterium]|nr:DUF3078 domain-containing protein [Muribaculaceae bacterium]
MKHFITLITATIAITTLAQNSSAETNLLSLPLVYTHQQATGDTLITPSTTAQCAADPFALDANDTWLKEAKSSSERTNSARYRAMVTQPQLVAYNESSLPEPPKEYEISGDPKRGILTIAPPQVVEPVETTIAEPPVNLRNWLHTFQSSLHFTQAYISENWYQGGEKNLNILADIKWDCNLNQEVHPNWLFNNSLSYKLGIATAPGDSIRDYMINEDNFLFTSQLGYKAVKHWYYSAMLQFKTQFFNNYKSNTRQMTAAFLSPGELNLGLGMTYDHKTPDGNRAITVAIAPLSYNLKICRNIDDIDPTTFGIDAGKHYKHSFGSNIEAKLTWKLHPNIQWISRFYVFTDYSYVQGDWENTFDFSITKYLNTKIYTHLRYDKSTPRHPEWHYWQFKEILSFGIVYRFATN